MQPSSEKTQIVNISGRLLAAPDAKISVFDRGFLFGDSVYETMRTFDRRVFLIERHFLRLRNSASLMRLQLPFEEHVFVREVQSTIGATINEECYVRVIVTRGQGRIGLDPSLAQTPTYVIIANPFDSLPAHYYTEGVKVAIVSVRRNTQSALNPRMKSGNLLNNILAYSEAKEQSAFEGILCNMAGYITEGTGSNVFIARRGKLFTPALESGLLEGVTRGLVLELASDAQLPCEEKNITPDEFVECEECFITGTTKGILPVSMINERRLENTPGPLTRRIMQAYGDFVKGFRHQ